MRMPTRRLQDWRVNSSTDRPAMIVRHPFTLLRDNKARARAIGTTTGDEVAAPQDVGGGRFRTVLLWHALPARLQTETPRDMFGQIEVVCRLRTGPCWELICP